MELLYKDLSGRIIGCVFDVFREIGPGYDEFTYHQSLKVRLAKEGLQFLSKPHFKINYRGVEIIELEPDFLVDDKTILELKAIQSDFLPENYTKIISYLRLADKRLGILINFGLLMANFKRVPFDERPLKIIEDYNELAQPIRENEEFRRLRDSIVNVAKELRLGYHTEIYQKTMRVELELEKFFCEDQVKVPVYYQNAFINNYAIDFWRINGKILLAVLAGSKEVSAYDILRMRSYLKRLSLSAGLIAFWGKDQVKIVGVSPQR